MTSIGYQKASAKASEIVGDATEYVSALMRQDAVDPDVFAIGNPNQPVKDLPSGVIFNETGAVTIGKTYATEQFVNYYISSILDARGYEIYNGAVYYKGDIYGGIIFTKGDVFIEDNGQTIRSCGFVQLVSDDYTGTAITDSMVQTGLIAITSGSSGTGSEPFIVEEFAVFDDFSGIFNDTYFCIKQLDHYVVSVSIKENKKENYDSKIELYDFDNDKYIYSAVDAEDVERLFVEDNLVFQSAATTVNAIVDVGENSVDDLATVFVLDGNTLDTLLSRASSGTDSATSFIKNAVKGTRLGSSQFLSIDSAGKAHVLGIENENDEARLTNGIITTVSSGLAAAGAVASIVCVAHAGALVVTAIVITTGTSAIVYNVSNLIAGSQDIYYGAKGSVKESENPVLNLFKAAIPDEQTATLVYHIWGASNTIFANLMVPATKALNIAKARSLNSFQAAVNVIRASLVSIAKVAATGVGAGAVASYVSKVVSKVSRNENIGRLAGFGACLLTGFLVYSGLDAVDQHLDISGLYPKSDISMAFAKALAEQAQNISEDNFVSMSSGEKAKVVDSLVDQAMGYLEIKIRPSVKIVYDSNTSVCGSYDVITDTVTVNLLSPGNATPKGLANTIGHEMRHVWQWGAGSDEMTYSLTHYYSGPDYSEYRTQLCEEDALFGPG